MSAHTHDTCDLCGDPVAQVYGNGRAFCADCDERVADICEESRAIKAEVRAAPMRSIDPKTLPPRWLASWLWLKEGEAINPYAKGTREHNEFANELENLKREEEYNDAIGYPEAY